MFGFHGGFQLAAALKSSPRLSHAMGRGDEPLHRGLPEGFYTSLRVTATSRVWSSDRVTCCSCMAKPVEVRRRV